MNKLNHQDTPQKQPREVMEHVRAELTKLVGAVSENSKKFAAAALTIMTLSGTAHAEDATNKIALNTTTPSASVPAAEKGGGQVVTLKNGKTMSFSEILKLSGTEKDELINHMSDTEYNTYEKYIQNLKLASNQRIEEKRSISEASNQEEKRIDRTIEASNQSNEEKREQLIAKYEQYISNIEKGSKGEKVIIEKIINAKFTPDDLKKRAQAILRNKNIILSGI